MLPKCGTLLTYGSADVISIFLIVSDGKIGVSERGGRFLLSASAGT
jgi:hypothetical protein